MADELTVRFKRVNDEVFYAPGGVVTVNRSDVEALKTQALQNPRKRARICVHSGVDDTLHEMLIVHAKNIFVRPHKHISKSESFHIMEGVLNIILFNDTGDVVRVIELSEKGNFFYRLSDSLFHTVVPVSDVVVFHETTNGPFNREDTIFATWSPDEENTEAQKSYLKDSF